MRYKKVKKTGFLMPVAPTDIELLDERRDAVIEALLIAKDGSSKNPGGTASEPWKADVREYTKDLNNITMAIVNTRLVHEQIKTGKRSVWVTALVGLVTAAVVLVAVWLGFYLGSANTTPNDQQPTEQVSPTSSDRSE